MNIKYIITKVLWKKISSALTETMQEASKIGGLMENCSNPKTEILFLKWKKNTYFCFLVSLGSGIKQVLRLSGILQLLPDWSPVIFNTAAWVAH